VRLEGSDVYFSRLYGLSIAWESGVGSENCAATGPRFLFGAKNWRARPSGELPKAARGRAGGAGVLRLRMRIRKTNPHAPLRMTGHRQDDGV